MPKYIIYTDTTQYNVYIETTSKSGVYETKTEIPSKNNSGAGATRWPQILVSWRH